ncbi:MAG: hypothetical protein MUE52_18885, partial [Tabrizicola sp.]|nr:hypothetical protein [Tabrizicola sp.]
MYSFQVVETFTAAPLNMISGISDMQLVQRGGNLMLYTATRAGGGVLALDVDANVTLVDQEMTAPGITLPAPAQLDLVTVNGTPQLLVSGANLAGPRGYSLEGTGSLGSAVQLTGGLTGTVAAQTVVTIGGQTYLYQARSGESTLYAYSLAPNGTVTFLGSRVLDGAHSGIDISALTTVSVGGTTYLVSLSLEADVIRTFAIGPTGALGAMQMLGAPQGLGISDPSAVEAVTMAGVTYLVVGSVGSSSISVVEVGTDGAMRVADHVVDTLDTRFAGVQAIETISHAGRVFVIAGGADGGLNLMTMLPDGRLVLVASQLQLPGLALDNITAITARMDGNRIDIFVAGEGTGITRLSVDLGPMGAIQFAGPDDSSLTGISGSDMLLGGDGNDLIEGGSGSDLLVDGSGGDTLSGGAGADLFVMTRDGSHDVIVDFQLGIDRIDLSAWGPIHSLSVLTITATPTGALIQYDGETLELRSPNGLPILPGAFRLGDFIGLWHAPPPESPDLLVQGTPQTDLKTGTAGNDRFRLSPGADTLDGGDGFDTIDLSTSSTGIRYAIGSPSSNTGLAAGQAHTNFEAVIGSRFNDTLTGDATANLLDGGDGTDRLSGGNGDDTLLGGPGNDFLFGGAGADLLDGGSGRDRARYVEATTGLTADLADPGVNTGEAQGDRYLGIEELEGSNHADTLGGDAQANGIWGMDGNDRLEGRGGADTLLGGNGNDTLIGGEGADRLDGGSGVDLVSYSGQGSSLRLDLQDSLRATGDAVGDLFVGIEAWEFTAFNDSIFGSQGDETFFGLAGNDHLDGRAGNDVLSGGSGTDSLYGGDGSDTLLGGSGADRLEGGAG